MQLQHERQAVQQLPLPAEQTSSGAEPLMTAMRPHVTLWQQPGAHAFGRITITAAIGHNRPTR